MGGGQLWDGPDTQLIRDKQLKYGYHRKQLNFKTATGFNSSQKETIWLESTWKCSTSLIIKANVNQNHKELLPFSSKSCCDSQFMIAVVTFYYL